MKQVIRFPYKAYKGGYYPLSNIQLKGPVGPLETEVYVDSGASTSIFLATVASALGLDFTKGKRTYTMVGDGSFIPVFLHRLPIQIGPVWFKATIGFSSHLGADFNLLGQADVFDRFVVSFDRRRKIVSFQPS